MTIIRPWRTLRRPACVGQARRRLAGVTTIAVVLGVAVVPTGATAAARPTVLAAASLTEVLPRIDPAARYSFGSSAALAFQIRQGAPADVFASASPDHTQELFREGTVERPVTMAYNRLALIVPRRNPASIVRLRDVGRPGVRLVVADRSVPVGGYTRTLMARVGMTRALGRAVSHEADVKGVVAKVIHGNADAGFVYSTDAAAAGNRVRTIPLPRSAQPRVRYEIAVVRSAANPSAARAYVAQVRGTRGRSVLRAAGFHLSPPPR